MILCDLACQQVQILERIYEVQSGDPPKKLTGVLKAILAYNSEETTYAMGEFGAKLKAFSHYIDTESPHPDLFALFEGELVGDSGENFSKDACDLLKLAAYGRAWGLSQSVLENLKRVITKHKSYKVLAQAIDSPYDNLQHVRFVPMRVARDEIRLHKRVQPVNLTVLYRRGINFWEDQPDSFLSYRRRSNLFQRDIDEALVRCKHFTDLGLKIMADEIQKSIDELNKQSVTSQYYGFNKISLTTASIILAKMSGYKYTIVRDAFDEETIEADPTTFDYCFFPKEPHSLFNGSQFDGLSYVPRAYTYNELEPFASQEIKDLIDYLEQFPDIGGKPLFDHYRVIVPGLLYPTMAQSPVFHFRLPDGSLFQSNQLFKAQMRLDVELLAQKEIGAVLLGERDGDCYFISYF